MHTHVHSVYIYIHVCMYVCKQTPTLAYTNTEITRTIQSLNLCALRWFTHFFSHFSFLSLGLRMYALKFNICRLASCPRHSSACARECVSANVLHIICQRMWCEVGNYCNSTHLWGWRWAYGVWLTTWITAGTTRPFPMPNRDTQECARKYECCRNDGHHNGAHVRVVCTPVTRSCWDVWEHRARALCVATPIVAPASLVDRVAIGFVFASWVCQAKGTYVFLPKATLRGIVVAIAAAAPILILAAVTCVQIVALATVPTKGHILAPTAWIIACLCKSIIAVRLSSLTLLPCCCEDNRHCQSKQGKLSDRSHTLRPESCNQIWAPPDFELAGAGSHWTMWGLWQDYKWEARAKALQKRLPAKCQLRTLSDTCGVYSWVSEVRNMMSHCFFEVDNRWLTKQSFISTSDWPNSSNSLIRSDHGQAAPVWKHFGATRYVERTQSKTYFSMVQFLKTNQFLLVKRSSQVGAVTPY